MATSTVRAAMRRVRAWLEGWDSHPPMVDEAVVCGSFGDGPRLDLADLRAVLEEAEGPRGWALVQMGQPGEDGMVPLYPLRTFLSEEEAWETLATFNPAQRFRVAFWDENGGKSCWRQR